MASERPSLGRREDIQILRAIAVILVVFYHLEFPFFENGFLGVDVFFVISGYLMATLYDRGSVIDFYKRRVDRLLPAYCFAIALTAVFAYFVLIPADFSQLFDQSLASLIFAPNIHFWGQTSYFEKDAFRPLLNLWSLGVEVQFYLLVPFLYALLRKRPVLLWICTIAIFIACLVVQAYSPKTSFFMMPLRIWEFFLGAVVAWFWKPDVTSRLTKASFQSFVLTLLIGFTLLVPIAPESGRWDMGHPGLAALFVCILTAVLIGIRMPMRLESSAIGRLLAKLGDYSYSIYLIHFPAIVLWNYSPYGGTKLGASNTLDVVAILSLTAVLSFLSYNLIETRGTRFTRSAKARLAMPLGMAVVVIGAYLANFNKYTQYQHNIFAAQEDRSHYRCGRLFVILNPQSRVCEITGTKHENRVLLVGDSHADSIKTRFAEVADQSGYSVYFYAQNNPLVRFASKSNAVIKDAQNLDVDGIVIHFNNDNYDNPGWVEEFERFLRLASASGFPVAILAPVPTYDQHVPRALYLQSRQRFEELKPLQQNKQDQVAAFRALMSRIDHNKTTVYDPSERMCPNGSPCVVMDSNGKPYYFDTNHLTLTGAAQLQPLFEEIIANLKR